MTVVVTASGWGCAASVPRAETSPASSDLPTLELLGAALIPARPLDEGVDRATHFGSLSGLAFDARTGRYLAVIDDRQPARIAWLDVRFDGRLHVSVLGVEPVAAGDEASRRATTEADLEAVAALADGTFVATEEGHVSDGRRGQPAAGEWPAALIGLSREAQAGRPTPFPPMFALGREAGGIRDNQGVESLTLTPDGRLVAGLERPRWADLDGGERSGSPFADGRGGPGRLVEFVPQNDGWRAARQWMYPIEPTRVVDGYNRICDDGENGLTELLALEASAFLALERACLQNTTTGAVRNTADLYWVTVRDADDVSSVATLDPARVRGARKVRLLDFDALVPRLPPELATLENFEALAFGPTLADGARTLIVASDDNFNATQKTAFLLFRIR